MEISNQPPATTSVTAPQATTPQTLQSDVMKQNQSNAANQDNGKDNKRPEISKQDFDEIADRVNSYFDRLDVKIKFSVFEKTNQTVLQVYDAGEHTLLREYPSEELLRMLASIHDYIGVLLDKKA